MCKYENYKQELIREVVTKQTDAFDLIEQVIEQCIKIDKLANQIEQLKGDNDNVSKSKL